MPPVDKDLSNNLEQIMEKFNSDKPISLFEASYKNYKYNEELERKYFEFEYFNYKLDSVIYTVILLFSFFFIFYSIYASISMNARFTSIESIFIIVETVFVFGYLAFLAFFMKSRKKRKFELLLTKEIECRDNREESKKQ